jgi:DNA processing protein
VDAGDHELGYLLAVSAACVWTPRPLATWMEALGSARGMVRFARSDSPGPPPGAEPLGADALERLRAIDDHAASEALAELRASGCAALTRGDAAYPARLFDLRDPPLVLYYRGKLEISERRAVAIVGSRAASSYGRDQAAAMASEFAAFGATVVSGFARGIDAAAHRGALDGGAPTIAVPGSGLNALYPDYHAELAARIVASDGLIVSEFPPVMTARAHHFPMRNRLVAALADATVVIEAGMRSGALITARLADELGRHVFAMPGDVVRPTSAGTNALIKDGVALVTSAADIAALLKWKSTLGNASTGRDDDSSCPLLDLLRRGIDDADSIGASLGESASAVAAQLAMLEIQGLVERRPGGKFSAVKAARKSNATRA